MSASTTTRCALAALALTAAFACGRFCQPKGDDARILAELRDQRARLDLVSGTIDGLSRAPRASGSCNVDLAAIRADVRAMLAESARSKSDRERDGPLAPSARDATPESLRAVAIADRVVNDAIRTRRWSDDQRDQLRAAMVELDDEQRQEVVSKLFPAINRQEIAVDVRGPIF